MHVFIDYAYMKAYAYTHTSIAMYDARYLYSKWPRFYNNMKRAFRPSMYFQKKI